MADFGVTQAPSPTRLDELLDDALMSRIERLDIMSRKQVLGTVQGERQSRRKGVSIEFADYRHYVPGDDLRFIDWNIFARLDRLFLRLFVEEQDLSLVIAIDTSASMGWGNPGKFDTCRRLAMALSYIGLVNHNRVSLFSFDDRGVQGLESLRGRRRAHDAGQWLLERSLGEGSGFDEAMKTIALSRKGRGVTIVLSDFLFKEGIDRGSRFIAGGGYDTFFLQMLAPEEVDPAGAGLVGDLKLTDLEDGTSTDVTVTPALLAKYRSNLDGWCGNLRESCIRRGILHVLGNTGTDLDELLIEHFRHRGILK